jgi:outer membrane receptor for ferrienterochelin and colicins
MAMLFFSSHLFAQSPSGEIRGVITGDGEPLPGATLVITGLKLGTVSNPLGNFVLANVPAGKHEFEIRAVGFRTYKQQIQVEAGRPLVLSVEMVEDVFRLDQVVVTATRNEVARKDAPVVVNVVNRELLSATQSVALSDGLSFQPGLRVENNCQNCGFTQVRMNGLDGPYTQVLINSRPIFSALQGVYGLEQIPASIVDRIEVVRGGGSALYGGNAIAGTINIITREPVKNEFEVSSNLAFTGMQNPDRLINASASLVSDDGKSGLVLYTMYRKRDPWDANGDGFSEITLLENNTFGGRAFYRPTGNSKIVVDFNNITEFRRGGNLFDRPAHQTDITEQLNHQINSGGITYETYSKNLKNRYTVYTSLQSIRRDSYYGGGGNPDNFEVGLPQEEIQERLLEASLFYGNTTDFSGVAGFQFYSEPTRFGNITAGMEYSVNDVLDLMPGYQRRIAQQANNLGTYVQYEWKPVSAVSVLGGLRYDFTTIDGIYDLLGQSNATNRTVGVLSPRLSLLYSPSDAIQMRGSYARGFRAPQAFDEDLHIQTVGGGAQFVRLSNDLEKETSDAFTLSVEHTRQFGFRSVTFLAEGFYTRLYNPFVNVGLLEGSDTAPEVLEKRNAEADAIVAGVNLEAKLLLSRYFNFQVGATFQRARYNEAVEVYELEDEGGSIFESRILRAPQAYGFFASTWTPSKPVQINLSGVYTGPMAQPYEGPAGPVEIRTTQSFMEINLKMSYDFAVGKSMKLQVNGGLQNMFNSFQRDFDTGFERDAGYIYGPGRPRTIFAGIKIASI